MNIKKILNFINNAIGNGYKYDSEDLKSFSRSETTELFSLMMLRVESRESELSAVVDTLEQRVRHRTKELEEKNHILNELAIHDVLTGLNNRRYFNEKLSEYSLLAFRISQPLGCIMCDIDHFKKFNDTYGHQAGDYVLVRVAEILKNSVRCTDICARYGGEEFVILLPNTPAELAVKLAEKLCRAVEAEVIEFEGMKLQVTSSFGVAASIEKTGLNENLVKKADEALYKAKQEGRNCVRRI